MNASFEFLFKYRPALFEKGMIAFRSPWPGYVTAAVAAAATALALWLYQRHAAGLPLWPRLGLAGLRAAAFLTLLAIFLQPVLVLHSVIPQKSFVAIAYDLSKSMEIRDGVEGQSRLEAM